MRIIVCVKQVPASNEVRLDEKTNTIIRDGGEAVINPFDSHALEAALALKEQLGGTVAVLSMGIPAAAEMLRSCVARGADEALLLTDRAFAGADTLATSYTLQKGVERLGGFDLLLCGKMAVDGDTAQIGPELATRLGLPHVSDVSALRCDGRTLTVQRSLGDRQQTLQLPLPAVLTVTRELNVPRLPSIAGVLRAQDAPIPCCGAAEAGADGTLCGLKGSPTQVVSTFLPRRQRTVQEITGDSAQRTAALLEIIKGGGRHGAEH